MCGITGIIVTSGDLQERKLQLDRMTDRLAHRGPDGRGIYWDESSSQPVGLGHRRLSIIDLATGSQPLCNETSDVWITFNGEIYNYLELRNDLEGRGHRFRTHSDTETIVHAYEEFGHGCLAKLRGMFSFAIWDQRKRELFFARDRMGEKPFVYMQFRGGFAFASELKALRTLPDFSTEINQEGLDAYLTLGFIPHPLTIYKHARKLPPAHFGVWKDGEVKIQRYWKIDATPNVELKAPDISERVNELVHEAVRLQLRSDVPLGAFLSGGMDSTTIVTAAQDLLESRVNTFTIGFEDPNFDESSIARKTSQQLGTNHCELFVHENCDETLNEIIEILDEPFADTSAVTTYQVAKLARNQIKVVLTGDGGDELFAGYDRYHTVDRLQKLESKLFGIRTIASLGVWDFFGGRGTGLMNRVAFRARILRSPFRERYSNWLMQFSPEEKRDLMVGFDSDEKRLRGETCLTEPIDGCESSSHATQAMLADMSCYLPDDLLYKVDMTSMARGLECRSPFLDHKLVEFVATIPFSHHRRRGLVKPVLANAFASRLQSEITQQPKRGFGAPLASWLKGNLLDRVRSALLDSRRLTDDLGLDRNAVADAWRSYENGEQESANRIWTLFMLTNWLHNHSY
jgi:asparagine synthase (glutamine-hydrolysing)